MARNTKGYHVHTRGKSKTYWVWWSNGKGRKVQRRVVDEAGDRIAPGTSQREADRHAARMYHEWRSLAGQSSPKLRVEAPDLDQDTASDPHTFGKLTARFVISFQHEWADRTKDSYGTQLRCLEEFFSVGRLLEEIRPEDADAFKILLTVDKNLSSETVKSKLEMARRVFNYGIRIGWIIENPFSGLKPPKKKKIRKTDPFMPDEVTKVLKTAKAKYPLLYPFVLTAALTGERRNSIRMLRVKDVDIEKMIITFPAEYTKQREEIRRPIPKAVQPLYVKLVAGRDPEEPLFLDHRGQRWRNEDLNPTQNENGQVRLFGRLLRDAGVRVRGLHNFRSGVDTNLVDMGMTLDQATAVTGHTKKVAEEAYLRLQLDSKRKAMDTLAEAYGIGELESAPEKKIKRPRKSKRDFKVELTQKEIHALEDLAARSELQKGSDSGTKSGTSPRRNVKKGRNAGQSHKQSAVSTSARETGWRSALPVRVRRDTTRIGDHGFAISDSG